MAQDRTLEVRLAFAQAEANCRAQLDGLVARVDQAPIDLTLADGTDESPQCDDPLSRLAASLGSIWWAATSGPT
ncbi:MAG: hypothetical protein H7345_17625 [Rubritepida sp.]|nr:hypothetical protein [Rubritepida sp.]